MPPFLVGAWRWDNLLLSEAVRDPGIAVIDATERILAVHLQQAVAGTLPDHEKRKFARYNDMLAKTQSGMQFMIGKLAGNVHIFVSSTPSSCVSLSSVCFIYGVGEVLSRSMHPRLCALLCS